MINLIKITPKNTIGDAFLLDVSRVKTVEPHEYDPQDSRASGAPMCTNGADWIAVKHADGLTTYHKGFTVDDVDDSIRNAGVVDAGVVERIGSILMRTSVRGSAKTPMRALDIPTEGLDPTVISAVVSLAGKTLPIGLRNLDTGETERFTITSASADRKCISMLFKPLTA